MVFEQEVSMPQRTITTFNYAMIVVAVIVAAIVLPALAFVVTGLAFDLFSPVFGIVVNVAIIVIFGAICWKMRHNLYDHLHFLH